MISRKIDLFLEQFFKATNKALLIDGARQVGKTFSIEKFGKTNFKNFVKINFIDNPEAINIFKVAGDSKSILFRLSAFAEKPLVKGETLIFFDEVQRCPEIVSAIKFLVEEGSYRYVLSGSLLGTELKGITSPPVGYMDIKTMYPLDFEEFLVALGISDQIIGMLKEHFDSLEAIDKVIHDRIMKIFRLYLVVGGMPSAVQKYLDTNNLRSVMDEQGAIIRLYKLDISQYDPGNRLYLDDIFDIIPDELNSKNKRFILKSLNENIKFNRYENSFLWMSHAGVALPVYNVEEPKVPLKLSRHRNLFKLFQNDVGLLAAQYADGIQLRILSGDDTVNFGAIYENFVAEELHAHGFDLYYFNSKKQGELDFVIEMAGQAVPIEVKSGKDYERHNALSNVMSEQSYDVHHAYVLCNDNIKADKSIVYLPIYMAMFIQHDNPASLKYTLDLSGLQ